jgi:serine/threonine-protein kinase
MSSSELTLVGRRIGPYAVEALLGTGGMGAVYRARSSDGRAVALKVLAAPLAADPTAVARFVAEARAIARARHPSIVDVIDFGRSDEGLSYFVMELLAGRTLAARLAVESRLPVGAAIAIALEVAQAMAAAHAVGVIHRDLKPENLFLVESGGLKILDFGIAKLRDGAGPRTASGIVLGTPGWMAPEQATGEGVDERSDVYALGVLLYRLLSGRMPFAGETLSQLVARQRRRPEALVDARSDVPRSLSLLVERMLAPDPARRPATMAELGERLRAVDVVAPVVPPTRLSEAAVLVPRRRWLAWVLGLVAAAAVIAIGVGLRARWRTPPAVAPPVAVTLPFSAAASPVAAPPAPVAAPPAPVAAVEAGFPLFVETVPAGAEIRVAGHLLGVTPKRLQLDHDETLRLRLPGYVDEELDVTRFTVHALVPLHAAAPKRSRPRVRDRNDIGLND